MKTESQSCCFCFNSALEGNIVDDEILELLKFLITNADTSALEHSTVCDNCLNKIIESCEYKTKNSSKMLMGIKKEKIYPEEPVICQKCKTACEQADSFPLMDCVTQIDWSDFVNYLFLNQDLQSLESYQICGSCRISVSNIQQFLKLIYVYDQSKMKCDIDYHDDVKATGNTNLGEDKIKQEIENYITYDKTEIDNVIEDNKTEVDNSGIICYADFKCKNDEVDLKLDYDNQLTDRCEKVDIPKEITSSGSSEINNTEDEQSEQGINSEECGRLKHDMRVCKTILNIQCNNRSQEFDNLLKNHKYISTSTSKIHKCDKCNYKTTNKRNLLKHKLKHKCIYKAKKSNLLKHGLKKYRCQHCIYETNDKHCLIAHIKIHNDTRDFKCTLCRKEFTDKEKLDDHLLKIHNCRDITSKTYECDKCSFATVLKSAMLQHNLKHGIVCDLQILKCYHCNYETYNKNLLISHIKVHNQDVKIKRETELGKYSCKHCIYETYNISTFMKHVNIHGNFNCTICSKKFTQRIFLDDHVFKVHKSKEHAINKIHECNQCSYSSTNFYSFWKHTKIHAQEKLKCTLCSKEFRQRVNLDDHLLKVHKSKNILASNIHECDSCSYATTIKDRWLKHKLTHSIKEHINIHNIGKFKCTLCSKKFRQRPTLDDHLLKIHNSKDNVVSKIYDCDSCSYETTMKHQWLKHKLTHGIKGHVNIHNNIQNFKCILCSEEFTKRCNFDDHLLKVHKSKGNVSKIYECDLCNYETTIKHRWLNHKLTHGIKGHANIRNNQTFKCTLCSKKFRQRRNLDDHLLKVHKNKDGVVGKIHECDNCSYKTTRKYYLLEHKLIH